MKLKEFLIYALIFFLPTQFGKHFFLPFSYISGVKIDYLAPTIYVTDCIFLLLFLLSMHRFKLKFSKKIIIVSTLIILNIFFSLSPWISFYKWLKFAEIIVLFYLLKTKLHTKTLLIALISSALIQLILVVYQIYTHHALQGIAYFLGERYFSISTPGIAKSTIQGIEILRGYGTFSHPNSMGGFYLLFYVFILFEKRFNKFIFLKYIFLSIAIALVFLSFSKIAIISLLVITIYYASKYITCKFCAMGRIIVLSVLSILFLSVQGDPDSLEKRVFLTKNAIITFLQHPLIGTGAGAYLLAQLQFPIHYSYLFLQPVHNIVLLSLAELGLPIVGIGVVLLWKNIKTIYKKPQFTSILLVLIFTGLFDHYWLTLQQNMIAIPVVFALLKNQKWK